jgi:pimeloyl-ACP methyl ester carboxylesterase
MGGSIAQLMSVYFPERIMTLALIATSSDMRPSMRAFAGLPPEEGSLPTPTPAYLNFMKGFVSPPSQTEAEKLEQRLAGWRILNGSTFPFDEEENRQIHQEFLDRLKHPEAVTNHIPAINRSHDLILTVPGQVKVPTLILHGTEDPILPEHGKTLAAAIPSAKYILVEGMGHNINRHFEDLIIEELLNLTSR